MEGDSFFIPEKTTRIMKGHPQEPVNVKCEKCSFWGWVKNYKKTETGHICKDCEENPEIAIEIQIVQNGPCIEEEPSNIF